MQMQVSQPQYLSWKSTPQKKTFQTLKIILFGQLNSWNFKKFYGNRKNTSAPYLALNMTVFSTFLLIILCGHRNLNKTCKQKRLKNLDFIRKSNLISI